LTAEEEEAFYQASIQERFVDMTPEAIVAILASEMIYLGSPSTLYRILRKNNALQHRQASRKPIPTRASSYIPVTGPNQVWAWDITWVKTGVRGIFLYEYSIIDLYDRRIVGWCLEDHESEDCAQRLFARVIRDLKTIPLFIHADNGNAMRGSSFAVFLDSLGVTRSHSRPRISNDNAFIESWFKTLKYSVSYPGHFTSLEQAREWFANFVHEYNTRHLHSGLDYVTPLQVNTGVAEAIYQTRNETLERAKTNHPGRWKRNICRKYGLPSVRAYIRPFAKAA
jgi:transposase InsO family protein